MTEKSDQVVFEVTIEKIVPGGKGLSRHEGKVIFVKDGLPGEKLKVKLTKAKKDFAEAEIIEIINPSQDRVKPGCSHYLRCGGCDFQHLKYEAQLASKKLMIEDSLKRIGGIGEVVITIHPSPQWQYRQRARFSKLRDKVGFKANLSNEVIPIDSCPVLIPKLNHILIEGNFQSLPWIATRRKQDTHFKKVSRSNRKTKSDLSLDCAVLSNGETNLVGPGSLDMRVKGKVFKVENSVFFQSNAPILGDLVDWVSEQSKKFATGHLLDCRLAVDLFSGVGFFATFLADHFDKVIAVERNMKCLELARINCPSNVEFYVESVEKWAKSKNSLSVNFLVVDPPREGLDSDLIPVLHQWRPQKWIYVSCNPVTLARDINRIQEFGEYRMTEVKGFDFYPQTSHVEAAAVFELSG